MTLAVQPSVHQSELRKRPLTLLISAAEVSSDIHAAKILAALKAQVPDLQAFGVGGRRLRALGLRAVVPSEDLLAMGSTELLGRLKKIIAAGNKIEQLAILEKPDVALLFDYPDFHFRLAKKLKRQGIRVIDVIPPKVWIWRKKRIAKMAQLFDLVIPIFPFEQNLLKTGGVNARYCGNPIIEALPLDLTKSKARDRLAIESTQYVLTALPGSRPAELKAHLPLVLGAAFEFFKMKGDLKGIGLLLMALPEGPSDRSIETIEAWKKLNVSFRQFFEIRVCVGRSAEAMLAADFSIIKSGTSTLEAGLLGAPHIVIYKPSWLTHIILRKIVRYLGPVGLVNLATGYTKGAELRVPEFTVPELDAQTVGQALTFWSEPRLVADQQKKFLELREVFRGGLDPSLPSERIARTILEKIYESSARSSEQPSLSILSRFSKINFISFLWSLINCAARKIYRSGFLKSERLPARVIVIGNLQAGGAGKTPIVMWLSSRLLEAKKSPAVLLRGYLGELEKSGVLLLPGQVAQPKQVGDEAALIRSQMPGLPLFVGSDRVQVFRRFQNSVEKVDNLILDDGFQHFKIKADVNLLVVTSSDRNQVVFRDFYSQVRYASAVLWTKGTALPLGLLRATRKYGVPVIRMHYDTVGPIAELMKKNCWLVTGVGNGHFVRESLVEKGVNVEKVDFLEDHFAYTQAQVEQYVSMAKNSGLQLVTTAKDWVKWAQYVKSDTILVVDASMDFYSDADEQLWRGLEIEGQSD